MTERYRPSNGTDGEFFYEGWCAKCERERPSRQCSILTRTFICNIDDPEYPTEWVYGPNDVPCCTAFRPHKTKPHNHFPRIRDKRQIKMPL